MSKKERPLPRPQKMPSGRRRFEEREDDAPLMADRMAAAMAEGKLDEFMKEEMPDNEYARTLAAMMMGMTGMTFRSPAVKETEEHAAKTKEVRPSEETQAAIHAPEDVIRAVQAGDVKGVMEVLAREHKKRVPEAEASPVEEEKSEATAGLSGAEKEALDRLMKIASENNVSVDWLVLRALRLYITEYQRTGRL
jgi:ABC-type sugar transport system ATPase subunit